MLYILEYISLTIKEFLNMCNHNPSSQGTQLTQIPLSQPLITPHSSLLHFSKMSFLGSWLYRGISTPRTPAPCSLQPDSWTGSFLLHIIHLVKKPGHL
jgi:hypothetical protein